MKPWFRPPTLTRREMIAGSAGLFAALATNPLFAQTRIQRVPIQYIASLAGPQERAGTGAETWGLWREDPGPIGVWLHMYEELQARDYVHPTGWRLDVDDWWLDENGILMKHPDFPMPPGTFLVTNGEDKAGLLTVEAADASGAQVWSLSGETVIADVTHGPCRSARYSPIGDSGSCSPASVDQSIFPLPLGAQPPEVPGCNRLEYAVLIVIGIAEDV